MAGIKWWDSHFMVHQNNMHSQKNENYILFKQLDIIGPVDLCALSVIEWLFDFEEFHALYLLSIIFQFVL